MTYHVRIERATIANIPAIQKIAQVTWAPTYASILSEEQLKYMLDWMYSTESLREQFERGCQFLLLWEDENPRGFAGFELGRNGGFKLHKLYVLPSQQKSGYGQKILDEVISIIKSQGGRYLDLNVNRINSARFFYEKSGFFLLREEDNYIGRGYWMNDFVMRKSIEN